MDKIAIPVLDESVAPRFEAARNFLLATAEGGQIRSTTYVECSGPEGYRRVRMLQIHCATILICSGINSSYRDMLSVSGVTVIPKVSGRVDYALGRYLEGKLVSEDCQAEAGVKRCVVPHENLLKSARDLFHSHGYEVSAGPGPDSFLIDLVAKITCPVCGRSVKVAICCGAHTYRSDQEIVEFHHATSSGYNARVYVSPPTSAIEKYCQEYGIELLVPEDRSHLDSGDAPNRIPLLTGTVAGHERASGE